MIRYATRSSIFTLLALSMALPAGCGGAMRLGKTSDSDIEAAYQQRDEATLFDTCEQGVNGLLDKNGTRGKSDALACDRYGLLQLAKLAAAAAKPDMTLIAQVCKDAAGFNVHPKSGKQLTRGYNVARFPDQAPEALRPVIADQCKNLGATCNLSISSVACALEKSAASSGNDKEMAAAVASCDPEVVDKAFTRAYGDTYGGRVEQRGWFVKSNVALMKCGEKQEQWVLQRRLHWGKGYGEALADALAGAGVDLEQVIMRHLAAHPSDPFNFENSGFAAGEASRWMRRNKRFGACKALTGAYPRMSFGAQVYWLWYFLDAGCKDARPFAEAILGHKNPDTRIEACQVLGGLGDAGSAKKMASLASSDPVWKWRQSVRYYPVRDACQQAINAIKSR